LVLLALGSVVGVVIGLWIIAAVLGLFARVIAKGVTVGIAQGRRPQNVWTAADRAFLAPPRRRYQRRNHPRRQRIG
jgi:hypothetical protein